MEDLQIIDCVERIRKHLLAEDPQFHERVKAAQPDKQPRDPERMKWRLAAVVLGLDDTLPAARRELRRVTAGHFVAREAVAEEPAPDACMRLPQPQQALLEESLAAFDGFAGELNACATPAQAAALAKRRLPVLRGRLVHEYLASIDFPLLPHSAGIGRLMHRLGMISGGGNAQFRAAAERATRAAEISHAELALLFGLFSGARRDSRHEPVCTPRPRCGVCPVSVHCLHFRVNGAPPPGQPRVFKAIRDWTEDARPRERLLNGHHLPDVDLLAILLATGTNSTSAVDLARMLLARFGTLHRLGTAATGELQAIKGIGPAKAAKIKAALEIGKRAAAKEADIRAAPDAPFGDSASVFERYRARFMGETQERFVALLLNTRNRLIREVEVSVGTLNASIVHPREAFRHAITEAAAAVIFLHNHPSGDPSPSMADREMTRRLVETGNIVGIRVLDHVIIGAHSHYSFADNGEIS